MDTLLKDPELQLVDIVRDELDLILEARLLFMEHEKELFELRGDRDKNEPLVFPNKTREDLIRTESNLRKAVENLSNLPDSIRPPQKVMNQLNQVVTNVKQLSQGQHDGPYGYDLDMFHQNLINALKYLMKWRENTIDW